jgi:hypothetical protein
MSQAPLSTSIIILTLIVFALAVPLGCVEDGPAAGDETICTEDQEFDWWTACDNESDCCVGAEPVCTTTTLTGDIKICTRECTLAPEKNPVVNACASPEQTHGCGTGCCLINFIHPEDGSTTAGWGIGCCVPGPE